MADPYAKAGTLADTKYAMDKILVVDDGNDQG